MTNTTPTGDYSLIGGWSANTSLGMVDNSGNLSLAGVIARSKMAMPNDAVFRTTDIIESNGWYCVKMVVQDDRTATVLGRNVMWYTDVERYVKLWLADNNTEPYVVLSQEVCLKSADEAMLFFLKFQEGVVVDVD